MAQLVRASDCYIYDIRRSRVRVSLGQSFCYACVAIPPVKLCTWRRTAGWATGSGSARRGSEAVKKGMPPNNDAGPSHNLSVSYYLFGMQASLYVLVDIQPTRSILFYVIVPLEKSHNTVFA
jgi:hypothetical protein